MDGRLYYVGSPKLFEELHSNMKAETKQRIEGLQKQGKTVMVLGTEQQVLALIAVADEVRESSKEVIVQLHAMGIKKTIMLTGDNQATAAAIGQRLDVTDIKADLMSQ